MSFIFFRAPLDGLGFRVNHPSRRVNEPLKRKFTLEGKSHPSIRVKHFQDFFRQFPLWRVIYHQE
jgi:hypothetical protein